MPAASEFAPVFTASVTVAGVAPPLKDAVSQVALEDAVSPDTAGGDDVTLTVCAAGNAPPAVMVNEAEFADRLSAGAAAACVTAKLCPAITSVADRAAAVLAETA